MPVLELRREEESSESSEDAEIDGASVDGAGMVVSVNGCFQSVNDKFVLSMLEKEKKITGLEQDIKGIYKTVYPRVDDGTQYFVDEMPPSMVGVFMKLQRSTSYQQAARARVQSARRPLPAGGTRR